jgi:hypothetical protein
MDLQFDDINLTPRKIIIPKESQYTIDDFGQFFTFRYNNRIYKDINCNLNENLLPTIKFLSKLCKLDSKNMKKQEIINQLQNYIIFVN